MRTIKYDRINKSNSDLNLLKPRLIVLPNGDQILNIKDICSSSVPFNQRDNFDIIINISNHKNARKNKSKKISAMRMGTALTMITILCYSYLKNQ